ncbi:tetratricopeptide repeat protein [Lichenihabitans sp. PAMC28606]|uniref:tetratricopeptide repeat protein n=1 Tax=Lichenihabitans sp. PAMC28606 TaxID=2880932 RepID=UPI001D0A0016|nr:tetratricopeptide repeat protein [Lichenihabitans sp. PAMC28606]UDL93384.1 tetratricopeptide repeat protein [Lichenihabitans sp. PAMC28606]
MSGAFKGLKLRVAVSNFKSIGDRKRDQRAWSEAADAYQQHVDRHPSDFSIWVQLGNCCKEAGRLAAAEQAYQYAVTLNEQDADVRLQLGHLLKLQNRKADALRAYEATLALAPDNADARHEIASILGRTRSEARTSAFDPLGASAQSLDELLQTLKADQKRADVFAQYFADFVPT